MVPIIQVFTYKIDTNRYLIKFKARLYIRGNLQQLIYKDTYIVTLAAKVFRALIAIIAAFDLDVQQGDAVNAFINSLINEIVYI